MAYIAARMAWSLENLKNDIQTVRSQRKDLSKQVR
jgi:hypothetical protein